MSARISWGIEISAVEIKDVLLPEGMRRAIAKQAEAERERRAKVINAQGELGLGDSCLGGTHAREPACIIAAALPPDSDRNSGREQFDDDLSIQSPHIVTVALTEVLKDLKRVDPQHDIVQTARELGISPIPDAR